MAGIRLYFKIFPNTYIESTQLSFRKDGMRYKQRMKSECAAQITSRYTPIKYNQCPVMVDITFISAKNYGFESYNVLANYILDTLRTRGIIQDTTIPIINEVHIRVVETKRPSCEGAYIRFEKNPDPYKPDASIMGNDCE